MDASVKKIVVSLRKAFPAEQSGRDEWLRAIYSARSERFLSDNSTIWTTGAIMIPVAFAAFAIPIQSKVTSGWSFLVLALASISVLLTWIVIAENYRAFQNKSLAVMQGVEIVIGFEDPLGAKVRDKEGPITAKITNAAAIRTMRWLLLFALAFGWSLLFIINYQDMAW